MQEIKMKTCRAEGCENKFRPFLSTDKYCSSECAYKEYYKKDTKSNKTVIRKHSKKNASIQRKYTRQRKAYLSKAENKSCVIEGTDCTKRATTIEHSRGRGDYYVDEYAEAKEIPLTLDERFWKPACLNCNLELENNSELSKAHQLSKIHGGKKL